VKIGIYSFAPEILALLGSFVGSIIGLLLRPSLPLVGQLPISLILASGKAGADPLVAAIAKESFDLLQNGFILGGIFGFIAGVVIRNRFDS
jgi:hypothetical protein